MLFIACIKQDVDGGDKPAMTYPELCLRSSLRAQAKQSSAQRSKMDCFVADALRNDVKCEHALAISRHVAPEICQKLSPFENRGRGECRVPNAPAAWCAHIDS